MRGKCIAAMAEQADEQEKEEFAHSLEYEKCRSA
jgi:hypothetical protein